MKKYRVILEIESDPTYEDPPDQWDWHILIGHENKPELISFEEINLQEKKD